MYLEDKFQTLIGILQTTPQTRALSYMIGFQTLIGILQTVFGPGLPTSQSSVSNPYRYSTNKALSGPPLRKCMVSNPYRYSTNATTQF